MPLDLPSSAEEVELKAKTDVQRELVGSNPFFKNSVLGAFVTAVANRIFDYYVQLRQLINILLPDTAIAEFLERWASIFGKTRLAATKGTGSVVATGTPGSSIVLGTVLASSDNVLYDSTLTVVIANSIISVSSLTRVSQVVTVVTVSAHNWASNVAVTIAGVDQTEYNGVQQITVVDDVTFQYTVVGSPTTPATGSISAAADSITVPLESQDFQDSELGVEVNQDSGASLTLQSPIVGVDDSMTVDVGAIGGGTDQEGDNSLRGRTLEKLQNPTAHFNVSDIVQKAKEIAGVTRVFVFEVTPDIGQVTINFMRDNDDDPIPTASEVTTVKTQLLTIKPANTADVDMIVAAPVAAIIPFVLDALSPNTPTMQNSVTANLNQFFAEDTSVGVDIDQDAYRAAIQNTVDPETGDRVENFSLGTPIGDITIATGEIGVLGTVTYP